LVAPERTEIGLRWMLDRNGGATSRGIDQIATLLKQVARRFVRIPEADQKVLDRWAQRLAFRKPPGMTTKNRDRLRPLQDQATLRHLLDLPDKLFGRAEAGGDTYAAALEREDAVAIALLLVAPIRRTNLSTIHLDRNLQRPGRGALYLAFAPEEVKNRQPIEFEIPVSVGMMIDRHLATRSPRLCPADTPWLFPRRDGAGPMHPDGLSKRIRTRLHRELGLDFHPHLFRHLAGKLLLEAYPGSYEAVRHLLGHARLSSTLNAYIGLEAATAARLFAEAVETARRG
jgi:integrase